MKLLVGISSLLLAASCPVNPPGPNPTPTPTNTPTPSPTATPTIPPSTCSIPGDDSKAISPRPASQFTDLVNSTLQNLYGGDVQSRVVINEDINTSLNRVVSSLLAKGACAGTQPGADEICILVENGKCQGYHVFTCGTDCSKGTVGWAPGSVRDTWVGSTITPTPNPIPVPTPTPTIPPTTPPVTCNDFTGFRDIKTLSRVGNRVNINSTPQGCNADKCNALGYTGRNCCPLGSPGANQEACEGLIVGGSIFSLVTDNPIASVNELYTNSDNAFLGIAKVSSDFRSATIKVCGMKVSTICTQGTIQ